MFNASFDFFLFTAIEWSSIGTAKITTNAANNRNAGWIMIVARWADESFTGTGKFTCKTTFITLVNWGIGAIIGDMVVTVIPDIF